MRAIKYLTVTMLALASLPAAARDSGDPWTAEHLNQRYQDTSAACDNDTALYLCTGVIMRGTRPGEAKHVWWPEAKSVSGTVSAGGVSFSYVRADIPKPNDGYHYKNGFTVFPQTGKYAAPKGKMPLTVLCAFPMDAGTDVRSAKGCGATRDYPAVSQVCGSSGNNVTTGQQWINLYKRLQGLAICGFNTQSQSRAAFQPVMDIFHTLGQGAGLPNYNEIRIGTWTGDDATSKVFPIESFFYVAGNAEGLANARNDQLEFFQTTGQFVPIVKAAFPAARNDKMVFSYNKADQGTNVPIPTYPDTDPGTTAANPSTTDNPTTAGGPATTGSTPPKTGSGTSSNPIRVNEPHEQGDPWTAEYMWRRYNNLAAGCGVGNGGAAFLCTGVLLRGTHPGEAKHVWWPEDKSLNPKSISNGGVSFSYLRVDIRMPRLAFSYPNGFTVLPQLGKYSQALGQDPMQVLCAFPLDAWTDQRDQQGCGARSDYPQVSRVCGTHGITTGQQWVDKYPALKGQAICGFDTRSQSRESFQPMLDASHILGNKGGLPRNNEVRIASWPATDEASKNMPIESFFYVAGQAAGLKNAQNDQLDFFNSTGKFVPIVQIVFPTDTIPTFNFHYNKADQNPGVPLPTYPYPDPKACDTNGGFDMVC